MTSTAEPDYWSLLGLGPEADADQLKRAFRREARRWHPDLNGNDPVAEERFKLVNEAYAVLSDPRRRSAWEQGDPGTGRQEDPFEHGFPDFEDFLEVVLGEPSRRSEVNDPAVHDSGSWSEPPVAAPPPPPPVRAQEDLESIVELTPDQALHGTTVELNLEDGTVVELDTPPQAGDGWRLRLEGVASGGRDHFLQLRQQERPEAIALQKLRDPPEVYAAVVHEELVPLEAQCRRQCHLNAPDDKLRRLERLRLERISPQVGIHHC